MAKDYRPKTVHGSAVGYVEKLNLPALKRECIIRGMPFEEVTKGIPHLQTWFLNNFSNKADPTLPDKYDDWARKQLMARGADSSLLDPVFNLGSALERGPNGEVTKKKRVKSRIPKAREKKPRTEEGLYTGTKKALTFDLQKQGKSKAEVIELVKAQFPDAKEKSIGIWYNKCKRLKSK